MARWSIIFYPPGNRRNSPKIFLDSLSNNERISIQHRLQTISDLNRLDWPSGWLKKVQGILQLTAGDFRLYLGLDGDTIIVISHICRKHSQKADQADIDLAKENLKSYFQEKKNHGR